MDDKNIIKKDTTKEKIILFVIGVLLGAVISTTAFLICVKTIGVGTSTNSQSQQMPGGTPPEMPSGENGQSNQGQPPEKPSGDSDQNQSSTKSNNS